MTFAEWLQEQESRFLVQKTSAPGSIMAKGGVRPANPAKLMNPYQGVHFPTIFGKPDKRAPSGTISRK
jgi:hypothetical protein